MAIQIQLRSDTAANWTSADPTLAHGEFAYESDTGKFKVGDGTTSWTGLSYAVAGPEGPPGIDGAPGPQGDPGADGAPGSDATVNATNVTAVLAAAASVTPPADADEVPLLQSGVLKRVSFSSIWTWIKAKVDAGMTWAGAQSFSGQVEMTGQSATNATSAMTRGLVDMRTAIDAWSYGFQPTYSSAFYAANNTGTGSQVNEDNTISMRTGATAGSVSAIRTGSNLVATWHKNAGSRAVVNWSLKTVMKLRIIHFDTSGADTVARCLLGQGYTVSAAQDWAASDKGIGFKVINSVLYVHVANGSAVTTTSTGVTLSGSSSYDISLMCDGAGAWYAYVNGSLAASGTGAPTGNSSANANAMQLNITNGTTAGARYFNLVKLEAIQF